MVLNGSRDSKAVAVEQIRMIETRILQAVIESGTEIEILGQSTFFLEGHAPSCPKYLMPVRLAPPTARRPPIIFWPIDLSTSKHAISAILSAVRRGPVS